MILTRNIPSYVWVLTSILACATLFAMCVGGSSPAGKEEITNANGEVYTGSEACGKCHQAIGDSYRHTAHALASAPADRKTIKGSFSPGENEFSFNDYSNLPANVKVVMEQRDSGLYQTAYINGVARRSQRFGITIGSGRSAQSYLYWRENQLLQLPISYFSSTNSWANSPGFPHDQVKFNRLIPAHCMECHATVATLLPTTETIPGPNPPAFFDRAKIIYGIGCESCHGPGARHVTWQAQHPEGKKGRYIVNPGSLSRQQSMDACSVCHSGIRTSTRPPFSFIAGDTAGNYFGPGPVADTAHAEVHGNQYGLLAASKCFRMSSQLECRSCHNTHVDEKNNLAVYSQRCMTCHQPDGNHYCKRRPAAGEDITKNCIDCHMPVKASDIVTLMVPGKKELAPLLVRTHLIAIYNNHKH